MTKFGQFLCEQESKVGEQMRTVYGSPTGFLLSSRATLADFLAQIKNDPGSEEVQNFLPAFKLLARAAKDQGSEYLNRLMKPDFLVGYAQNGIAAAKSSAVRHLQFKTLETIFPLVAGINPYFGLEESIKYSIKLGYSIKKNQKDAVIQTMTAMQDIIRSLEEMPELLHLLHVKSINQSVP